MSEVIRKWIAERMGIIVDSSVSNFGQLVKDGNLVSLILCNYGIIKDTEICPISGDYSVCMTNYTCLLEPLKTIGIHLSQTALQDLVNADGAKAYKFFYKLYLVLHDKSKLDFILKEKLKQGTVRNNEGDVAPIIAPPQKQPPPYGAMDYDSTKTLYEWHKRNISQIEKSTSEIREKYLKTFQEQINSGVLDTVKMDENNCRDIERRLKDMFHDIPELELPSDNPDDAKFPNPEEKLIPYNPDRKTAISYLENLKEKYRKSEENKILQTYMHKLLLSDFQTKYRKKQDSEFNKAVLRKVLRQSYYEKQMASKLLEIQRQKDRIIESRKLINEIAEEQRDQSLVASLSKANYNVTLASLKDYNERKRILELHKRLYEEKMQRKYLRHFELCRKVVDDLVNLSIRSSEYSQKYDCPVPEYIWQNWTTLFVKEQKLLTTLPNLENILECTEEEEGSEFSRQTFLDDKDIDNYLKQENGWFLEDLENMYMSLSEIIKLGENILCHLVNKILLTKYPKPLLPRCPTLPVVATASAIIGLENGTHLKILQKLLMMRDIIVFDQQDVTNYCLKCFQEESDTGEADERLEHETLKGKKALKGKAKKPSTKEKKKGQKFSKITEISGVAQKETQTPKLFPDEEITLTPAAQLGQMAYESLNLGLEINNYLFTKMLIEYLRHFKTIKGWVLVNYPETVADAMALELALTGKEIKITPPPVEEDEEEEQLSFYTMGTDSYHRNSSDIFAPPEDIYINKRVSKLCPVQPTKGEGLYHSYLTSFIRLVPEKPPDLKEDISLTETSNLLEIDDFSKVEIFYEKLRCKSSFKYKNFDADTVKNLVNLITEDNIFGLLIYNEILQVVFDCMEEKRKMEEETRKSISKKKDKESKKVIKPTEPPKKPKSIVINLPKPSNLGEVQPPRPGEQNWEYVADDGQLPHEYLKQLASTWEDIEFIYLNDFKQIFFQLRIVKNALDPYYHGVYHHMSNFITRPDNKQEYLHRFQIAFNDLENDLREDEEFKTELHCRILDFKAKLWEICTCRMRESEDERLRHIQDNWYTELCVETVNLFLSSMQLEMDRYVSTIQLFTDYYTFMATNELSVTKYNKMSLASYQIDEKLIIFLREAYISFLQKIQKTPFTGYTGSVLRNCLQFANSVYQIAISAMSVMQKLTQEPKLPKKKKPLVVKTPAQEPKDTAETLQRMINLNSEWAYAIEGEYSRIKFRLSLLEARAVLELDEIVMQGEKLFHGIYDKLDKRNQDELQSVNLACEIFHRATETCESVQPRLVISGAKFYMDGKEIMYNDIYQPMLPYLDETTMDIFYTIPQLVKLTKILLDLAPNGSLPLKTFTYLIEDIVAHQSENGINMLLPLYWHHLQTDQLQDVLGKIFGKIEYINWKDFIIYNLELPFPSEQELLDCREQFRKSDPDKLEYVTEVQFHRVKFWFEDMEFVRQTFSKFSIKRLLAIMFEIRPDCINYSALLLTFCKDQDPIIGVAKALGLCIGKMVCWNLETGLNYIEILRYQKFMDQEKNISEGETLSNISETKFPSNVDPESPIKEAFENASDEVESLFFEHESLEEEENLQPPTLCYVLPFNIILTIMTAALPWHTRVQCVQDKSLKEFLEVIYENSRNDEFQLVFTHDFLNNEDFKTYITTNYKFNVRSPAGFVQMKIEKCFCKKETLSESEK